MPKFTFVVEKKIELAQNIVKLEISTQEVFECKPGQILSVSVAPKVYRSYSVMQIESQNQKTTLHLLISTFGNGPGATFVRLLQEKDSLMAIGPSGKFAITENTRPKVFVATGTGLAPFVGMVKASLEKHSRLLHTIYFGQGENGNSWGRSLFSELEDNPYFQFITCFSPLHDSLNAKEFNGRVTKILFENNKTWENVDFYLCGNPNMIEDVLAILAAKKVPLENIFKESFELGK